MAELASVAQIGGTAQYRPITNTLGDQVALTQNQRNYEESKAKNDEQKKLAEDLANINALGLPKNIQADVQAKRDELIERVRNGEIDPYNYDFLAEAKGVAGYGAKVQNDYKNAITAAASEGQIIEQDENGNWVNRKQDYRNTILNPDLTVDDLYSAAPKFGNMTAAVKLDDKAMLQFVTDYNKLGADEKVELLGSDYGMLTKETISKLSTAEFENLSDAIENMGGLGFASTYADLNSRGLAGGMGFNDWKKQYITNLLPESQTEQDAIDNPEFIARKAAERAAATQAAKNKTEGYSVSSSNFNTATPLQEQGEEFKLPNIYTDDYLASQRDKAEAAQTQEMSPKNDADVLTMILNDIGADESTLMRHRISANTAGKGLTDYQIADQDGSIITGKPLSVITDASGKGVLIMQEAVTTSTSTSKGKADEGDGKESTSTSTKGGRVRYIPITDTQAKDLQDYYKVSFTTDKGNNTPQTPTASTAKKPYFTKDSKGKLVLNK